MGQFIGGLVLLILFGAIGFVVSRFHSTADNYVSKRILHFSRIGAWVIALAGGLSLIVSSMLFTVPANNVGVEVLFGKPRSTYQEGLHFKNPFSEVINIPGLQQESTYSAVPSEGERSSADAVEAVTQDNAVVDVDASILWSLDLSQAKEIYREYRTLEQVRLRLLRPVSRDVIRDCVAQYPFEEARTSQRQAIAACAEQEISSQTGPKGVVLAAVQIRNMSAQSIDLQASIDRKLSAEQAAREAEFRRDQASVDAETARIRAEGEANAEVARAEGVKQANILVGESLSPALLEFRRYEFLSQSGNTNWVIEGNVGVDGPQLVIPMDDNGLLPPAPTTTTAPSTTPPQEP